MINFISLVSDQRLYLQHLSKRPVAEALALYQPLLHSTYAFFLAPKIGKNLPVNSIKQIMSVLLGLMADNKLDGVDDPQYLKVINGICLKVLDATNFTNLNWYDFMTFQLRTFLIFPISTAH